MPLERQQGVRDKARRSVAQLKAIPDALLGAAAAAAVSFSEHVDRLRQREVHAQSIPTLPRYSSSMNRSTCHDAVEVTVRIFSRIIAWVIDESKELG